MNAITDAAAAVESGSGFEFVPAELRMIREAALRLGREVIAPTAAARDRDAAWPKAELASLAEGGFMGMLIPDEHGGTDAGLLGYCIALEAISGADCGVGTIFHVHNMFYYTLSRHGSAEQKRRFLPPGARGEKIGAWLLTEPHMGSDTANMKTIARRDGDHYVIDGTKQFISNGSEAGTAIVMAVTDPAAGRRGVTAFVVAPALDAGSLVHALVAGAAFGLVVYGTYDLTNLAVLRGWTIRVAVADVAWGVAVTAAAQSVREGSVEMDLDPFELRSLRIEP